MIIGGIVAAVLIIALAYRIGLSDGFLTGFDAGRGGVS